MAMCLLGKQESRIQVPVEALRECGGMVVTHGSEPCGRKAVGVQFSLGALGRGGGMAVQGDLKSPVRKDVQVRVLSSAYAQVAQLAEAQHSKR